MFFLKKEASYIGIDIGTTGIKIVELQKVSGRPQLVNYGYSEEIDDFSAKKNLQLDIPKVAAIIKKILADAQIKSIQAVAAMPSFSVFSSVINLSNVSEKDLEGAVMWEAKKVIPLDLEEMILDWKLIGRAKNIKKRAGQQAEQSSSGDGKKAETAAELVAEPGVKTSHKILLTAAPKILVSRYVNIFKLAQLNLLSLETEMFSLVRSLVGSDPSVIALIDWGAVNTDVTIIENGLPMFNRSLDTGGIMITRAIADSLRVDFRRAEQFKLDLNNIAVNNQGNLSAMVQENIAPIVNEIKYSFNLFSQENNKKIEKVILSGGGANLAGLTVYLSSFLNVNVVLGDPWMRIAYPSDLKAVLEDIGPKISIATGLALRQVS